MRRTLSTLAFVAVIAGALAASSLAAPSWTDAEANRRLAEVTDDTTRGTAGYMFEATFDRHLGGDIDPLCAWVDGHVPAGGDVQDESRVAVQDVYRAIGGALTAGGDGLPIVLANVCGYEDPVASREYWRERWEFQAELSGSAKRFPDPKWFEDPPYLWGPQRTAPGGPRNQ